YAKYAPYTVHTHVKSIRYPEEMREERREIGYKYGEYCCPLDEGDLDFARAIQILRDGGYDGDLVIEDESLGKFAGDQRAGVLKRDIATLRSAIMSTEVG